MYCVSSFYIINGIIIGIGILIFIIIIIVSSLIN